MPIVATSTEVVDWMFHATAAVALITALRKLPEL